VIRGAWADRIGLVALVLANLFVALQTLRHEWGYYEVMLVYWVEVVVLGGYNVLRMLVVGVIGDQPLGAWAARWVDLGSPLNRLGLTALGVGIFVVKFANFALAIGLFVLLLPALLATPPGERSAGSVGQALAAAGPGVLAAGGALVLSHGITFVRNFLLAREYHRVGLVGLVAWPYARMSLVGGLLLVGTAVARLLPGLGRQTLFAGLMVLLKLGADAVSHLVEHHWLAAERPPA
jgi:hypothetical protein